LKVQEQAEVPQSVPAGEASETGLTKKEILGTLGLGLIVAGVAAAIAFFTSTREKAPLASSPPDHPRHLVEFNLTDRSGRSVTQADLAGKFLVVNFVFTSCSLSCRAVNDRMEEIQGLVADASDVRLVSLTVDPRSDTPSVLAKFADGYHADTNRWLFLTGDKAELYRVIETSFIPKSPELEGLIPGGFSSTDRIMLVDPEGNVWASFDGLKRNAASAVVAEIEGRRKKHHHL
jgi:cytochrome oxidase Cu insertion factor (SCO1/SenC/PrrC family)